MGTSCIKVESGANTVLPLKGTVMTRPDRYEAAEKMALEMSAGWSLAAHAYPSRSRTYPSVFLLSSHSLAYSSSSRSI